MKDLMESSEVFTAHATISAAYFMLRQEQEKLDSFFSKRSPMEREIDKVTGFDKALQKKHTKNIILLVKCAIRNKKIIDADYSSDMKLLEQLEKFWQSLKDVKRLK